MLDNNWEYTCTMVYWWTLTNWWWLTYYVKVAKFAHVIKCHDLMRHPKMTMSCGHLPNTTLWSSVALRNDSSTTLPTGIVPWINVGFDATVQDNALKLYKSFHSCLTQSCLSQKSNDTVEHPTWSSSSSQPHFACTSILDRRASCLDVTSLFLVMLDPKTKGFLSFNPHNQIIRKIIHHTTSFMHTSHHEPTFAATSCYYVLWPFSHLSMFYAQIAIKFFA